MQPIQCYSGKEASLRKFLKCNTIDEKKLKQHIVPKGIMYPIVGAFRALILTDEKTENPDVLAKNSNLWSNLFKEVYICL